MPSNRWVDRTQPQTLMSATILLYLNAALDLLLSFGGISPIGLVLVVGQVAAGWGIANEKKWGYWLGVAMALLFVAFAVLSFSFGSLVSLSSTSPWWPSCCTRRAAPTAAPGFDKRDGLT